MGKTQKRKQSRKIPVRVDYNKLLKDLQMEKETETSHLSLVEKTLLKQQQDKNETTYIADEVSDVERLWRRREALMANNKNILVYTEKDNLIHDKQCRLVKDIPDDEFEMTTKYDGTRDFCEVCHRMALLRIAIGDDQKRINEYYKFFKNAISNRILHTLIIDNGGRFKFIDKNKNCIKVKVREDQWLLKKDNRGDFSLYHNNYIRLEGNKRNFTEGYHLQVQKLKNPKSLYYSITLICGYSYDEHLEAEHSKTDDGNGVFYSFECFGWIKRFLKRIRKIQ